MPKWQEEGKSERERERGWPGVLPLLGLRVGPRVSEVSLIIGEFKT